VLRTAIQGPLALFLATTEEQLRELQLPSVKLFVQPGEALRDGLSPVVSERPRLREQWRDEAGCVMVEGVDAIVVRDRRRSGSLG
jgi:hypothetical protein